jgi:type II secretory pathway component PulK
MTFYATDFSSRRPSSRRRRGAILFVALACLLVVMSMLGNMLQRAVHARRLLRCELYARQVECLVQAGLDRAAFKLQSNPSYRGESWETELGEGPLALTSQVVIEVTSTERQSNAVRVAAEFPVGDLRSVRRTRTFQIATVQPSQE